MAKLHKNEILADKITNIVREGINLDKRGVHFIDSTFSSPSIAEFSRIISDPDGCDALTGYEFLLFPDENTQVRLESVLENNQYSQSDMDEISRLLVLKQINTFLSFPDDREKLSVTVPENALYKFVQRLNILNRIDDPIAQTLTRCIGDRTDYLTARVRLRNRRFEFSESISSFLIALIEKVYPDPSVFWEALDYMIGFFNTFTAIKDIYPALIEKKQACLQLMRLAEINDTALRENAVEILMLKGARIASVCFAEIKKEMDLIDYICLTIYGGQ